MSKYNTRSKSKKKRNNNFIQDDDAPNKKIKCNLKDNEFNNEDDDIDDEDYDDEDHDINDEDYDDEDIEEDFDDIDEEKTGNRKKQGHSIGIIVFNAPQRRNRDENKNQNNENDDEEEDEETEEEIRKKKIKELDIPESIKKTILNKHKNIMGMDSEKQIEWTNSLLSIPFGKYASTPISKDDDKSKIADFFSNAYKEFDKTVFGLQSVKDELINYLAQFISTGNKTTPRVLALYGSPGVGKTHIVRTAIASVLNRPIKCINMGGIHDSSYFYGFEYTYSGAKYGIITQSLIEKKVMNPIICFEEVDKISETKDGLDVQNFLMHLTDPEQNFAFQDKYFAGIDINLSNAIIVFTLNDINLLNPILLNRLYCIKIPNPTLDEKINIMKDYVIPLLCKNIGLDNKLVTFSPDIIKYISNKFCSSDIGLRSLKREVETIILRLNVINLVGKDLKNELDIKFPLQIDHKIIDKILKKPQEKDIYFNLYT